MPELMPRRTLNFPKLFNEHVVFSPLLQVRDLRQGPGAAAPLAGVFLKSVFSAQRRDTSPPESLFHGAPDLLTPFGCQGPLAQPAQSLLAQASCLVLSQVLMEQSRGPGCWAERAGCVATGCRVSWPAGDNRGSALCTQCWGGWTNCSWGTARGSWGAETRNP